jgi:hypothetical protein
MARASGFPENLLPNCYSQGRQKELNGNRANDGMSMMALQIAATGASICSELALIGASARALGQRLHAAIMDRARDLLDPYRPELHYMRGPGPKWRDKHRVAARRVRR